MSPGLIIFLSTLAAWLIFGIWMQVADAHPKAREQAHEMLAEGRITNIKRYLSVLKTFAGSKNPEEQDLRQKLLELASFCPIDQTQ